MNQTSTGLLRMTDDERPFSKDLKDLFSTLIVSLMPFSAHRVRFTKVEYTFLSENAIQNLGSLKFSQSNRMPDPKDPSRIVTTTATTTFSMSKEMAWSLCQLFLDARFFESADGKQEAMFTMRGTVWQLTPKGITVLDGFCSRNGVQLKQLSELISLFTTQLITLERDAQTDKLFLDQSTVEVIFSRFVGTRRRGIGSRLSDSTISSYDSQAAIGVKTSSERRVNGRLYQDTFTGKAAVDWLMDYCTIVDSREAVEILSLFIQHNLMDPSLPDRAYASQNPDCKLFQPTKAALYTLSQRGKDLVNPTSLSRTASISMRESPFQRSNLKDSNAHRLDKILSDPTLCLLFREHLRETHCEENLSFQQEVKEFIRNCKAAMQKLKDSPEDASVDRAKELLASSYGIYNAFLAPGSPREINIDHQLRKNLASRMSKAVAQDIPIAETLQEVTSLFEDAQIAIFKLMTSDSVPKFLHSPKYTFQVGHAGLHV
ncbi:regulator of G protein signaling domain-containing protein [Dactylonectria estremocensis]|uniref:Regulator of G protein signaling domain-containing protein n=1 Tax=Dactylonectria estremocensis TaxID=1079267 RepID=A0A9P9J345_9HYPO|nr:regulator of G protein signaling domain-containing protein [Dactylonectria estremocensis]